MIFTSHSSIVYRYIKVLGIFHALVRRIAPNLVTLLGVPSVDYLLTEGNIDYMRLKGSDVIFDIQSGTVCLNSLPVIHATVSSIVGWQLEGQMLSRYWSDTFLDAGPSGKLE